MSRELQPVNNIKSQHICKPEWTCSSQFCSTFTREMAPEIAFKPNGHLLVDDRLEIKIDKLDSNQKVTVYAYLEEEKKTFESCGCFTADKQGIVNLGRQASVSGTYTGVSAMGLFWSLVPCPGQLDGIRLMKKNLDTPFTTQITVYDGHFSLEDIREKTPAELCKTTIERWYKSPGVTNYEVTDGNVRGKLYLPPGDGPFPAVIDLFGTVGGVTEYRSALLASRGFASLALPYFLYKDLPKSLFDLNLDYFLEAIDWLLSRDNIISSGLGVIGTSKGGDISLMMARYSKKVRAVVNINGCTFNATAPMKYSGGDIPEVPLLFDKILNIDGKYAMHKALDYVPSDIFQVWKTDVKILNILSEDDMCSRRNVSEC
ncbi:acyl-coenzyme A amino acid N-acyltransferase 1-like isoform X2 [Ruditapes philippinarum]|nr:acyl-coenzyme A amino acid N-acyltransferase 1-like isoform X2 [Ruditapes philippinarum]